MSRLDVALTVDRSVSSPCCCFDFIFRDDWIKRVKSGGRGRSAWCIVCLYKLGADKVSHHWSFTLKREWTATSIRLSLHFTVSRRLLQALELWCSAQISPWIRWTVNNMIYSGLGKYWKYLSSVSICIFKMTCQVLEYLRFSCRRLTWLLTFVPGETLI